MEEQPLVPKDKPETIEQDIDPDRNSNKCVEYCYYGFISIAVLNVIAYLIVIIFLFTDLGLKNDT